MWILTYLILFKLNYYCNKLCIFSDEPYIIISHLNIHTIYLQYNLYLIRNCILHNMNTALIIGALQKILDKTTEVQTKTDVEE